MSGGDVMPSPGPGLVARTRSVRTGDLAVSGDAGEVLVAHGLGSCIGVTAYDPILRIGGMAHVLCPDSRGVDPATLDSPLSFADLAVPELIARMSRRGSNPGRLRIALAGGAPSQDPGDIFQIGVKNLQAVKRALWEKRLLVHAESVGRPGWTTMRFEIATGRIVLSTPSGEEVLEA